MPGGNPSKNHCRRWTAPVGMKARKSGMPEESLWATWLTSGAGTFTIPAAKITSGPRLGHRPGNSGDHRTERRTRQRANLRVGLRCRWDRVAGRKRPVRDAVQHLTCGAPRRIVEGSVPNKRQSPSRQCRRSLRRSGIARLRTKHNIKAFVVLFRTGG